MIGGDSVMGEEEKEEADRFRLSSQEILATGSKKREQIQETFKRLQC